MLLWPFATGRQGRRMARWFAGGLALWAAALAGAPWPEGQGSLRAGHVPSGATALWTWTGHWLHPVAQAQPLQSPSLWPLGQRVLALGAQGKDVWQLQRLLVSLGFDLSLDGRFGGETRDAIRQFQKSHGLQVDGKAGPATVAQLRKLVLWHLVRSGETLFSLARAYGSTVGHLRGINGLADDRIRVGQLLLVPRAGSGGWRSAMTPPTRYQVKWGDTLASIAERHGVSLSALQALNGLANPDLILPGMVLTIPPSTEAPRASVDGRRTTTMAAAAPLRLAWPVSGSVSSRYGWRPNPVGRGYEFHEGLDIAVPVGTRVVAAAAGTVNYAGWLGAYGWTVVLSHGQDVETYYGHLSRILVRVGQVVRTGQVLALSGSTGRSTGPHLDFRMKVRGKLVNPLQYLQ